MSYFEYVHRHVLGSAGASGLMLGRTLVAAPGEASYYDYPGAPKVRAMPGVAQGVVARPYGYAAIEEMDSYGAWIGAPIDYLRFILAIDGQRGARLLNDASVREMLSRPELPGGDSAQPTFYGLGVSIRMLSDGRKNWWHTGVQPGFYAFALRTARGHAGYRLSTRFRAIGAHSGGIWMRLFGKQQDWSADGRRRLELARNSIDPMLALATAAQAAIHAANRACTQGELGPRPTPPRSGGHYGRLAVFFSSSFAQSSAQTWSGRNRSSNLLPCGVSP